MQIDIMFPETFITQKAKHNYDVFIIFFIKFSSQHHKHLNAKMCEKSSEKP